MSNATIVYALSSKAARLRAENYFPAFKLIERQALEGAELSIQALYQAKKKFRCENLDQYGRPFIIAPGEYFLLVDGKTQDATRVRLLRAARTKEEEHQAWLETGIPEKDEVYDTPGKDEMGDLLDLLLDNDASDANEENEEESPKLDENDYFKKVPIELPDYPLAHADNYVMTYEIREATSTEQEEIQCISTFTPDMFADTPSVQASFRRLLQIDENAYKTIRDLPGIDALIREIIRQDEFLHGKSRETLPHFSLVIAVIDGKTNLFRCGIWCYKRQTGLPMECHPVEMFFPESGYLITQNGMNVPDFSDAPLPAPDSKRLIASLQEKLFTPSLEDLVTFAGATYSDDARNCLLESCIASLGRGQVESFLLQFAKNPALAWARQCLGLLGKKASQANSTKSSKPRKAGALPKTGK